MTPILPPLGLGLVLSGVFDVSCPRRFFVSARVVMLSCPKGKYSLCLLIQMQHFCPQMIDCFLPFNVVPPSSLRHPSRSRVPRLGVRRPYLNMMIPAT
jgi:hypothetical protein